MLEIQKTTKISIARYLQIMQRQLEGKMAETIKFKEIPNITKVYEGQIKETLENATNLLVFDLKMQCRRVITEGGNQYGVLSLEGQTNWEGQDLEIKICLMKDFTLPTPEDLLLLPFQEIQIKIPPTQLTSNTKKGSFRINFSEHNVRWEEERDINSRMAKIITDRKTHEIKQGNGAHRREQNWMPSAPIGYQPSFNQAWGWQDQNNSGGWIPRDVQGPCYGELGWMPRMGIRGPQYGGLQYGPPVHTDQHDY